MMDYLRKFRFQIFLFTLGIFIVGSFAGFGAYFFDAPAGDPAATVAEVDGHKIPLRIYNNYYNRALQQIPEGTRLDDAGRKQKQEEALRDVIQGEVFDRLTKRYGIMVPDQQVAASLTQVPAFQENGAFSPQLYARALQYQLKTSPQDFEEEQRRSLAFFKLRWLIQSAVKVTDAELDAMWSLRGAEFEKAYRGTKEKKNAPASEVREAFREQIWQEHVMWSFNQWFAQIGGKVRVKTFPNVIEGGR